MNLNVLKPWNSKEWSFLHTEEAIKCFKTLAAMGFTDKVILNNFLNMAFHLYSLDSVDYKY